MSRDQFAEQYSLKTNITWMTVLKIYFNSSDLCIIMRDGIKWNSREKKKYIGNVEKITKYLETGDNRK